MIELGFALMVAGGFFIVVGGLWLYALAAYQASQDSQD